MGVGEHVAPVDIAPNDPSLAYLQSAHGPVDVETLERDSPALTEQGAAGVKLAVPLISQGELIGVLNLRPRRSATTIRNPIYTARRGQSPLHRV